MQRGTILSAEDQGTLWRLLYRINGNGLGAVNFDHRCFADFYEGATDEDFLSATTSVAGVNTFPLNSATDGSAWQRPVMAKSCVWRIDMNGLQDQVFAK